jgi:flagellar biosynthesis protein FlhG
MVEAGVAEVETILILEDDPGIALLESRRLRKADYRVVVAASAAEARDVLDRLSASSRQFLGTVVTGLGHVRSDPHVAHSVRARRPFLVAYPQSLASRGVRRLAYELIAQQQPRGRRPGFFAALAARWALSRVAR